MTFWLNGRCRYEPVVQTQAVLLLLLFIFRTVVTARHHSSSPLTIIRIQILARAGNTVPGASPDPSTTHNHMEYVRAPSMLIRNGIDEVTHWMPRIVKQGQYNEIQFYLWLLQEQRWNCSSSDSDEISDMSFDQSYDFSSDDGYAVCHFRFPARHALKCVGLAVPLVSMHSWPVPVPLVE